MYYVRFTTINARFSDFFLVRLDAEIYTLLTTSGFFLFSNIFRLLTKILLSNVITKQKLKNDADHKIRRISLVNLAISLVSVKAAIL